MLLDCLAVLLEVDGGDALLDEARRTGHRLLGTRSQEPLRSAFLNSLSEKQPRVFES